MKSNVKLPLSLVAGLSGAIVASCKSGPDSDGLVMVPMLESAPSATVDASADANDSGAHWRPAPEPRAPNNQTCTHDVHCLSPLPTAPTWPYAHPYELCDPSPLGETAKFSPTATSAKRADDPDTCCYVDFTGCTPRGSVSHRAGRVMIGRPLRDAHGEMITASASDGHGWASCAAHASEDAERAESCVRGAFAEHASVAEFARLSLVLMSMGAPADLLARVHRAALDEIEHAKICFALAARFGSTTIGPGPMPIENAAHRTSVHELVMDTLREGCVGEGEAAKTLAALAARETDHEIARAFDRMARDEQRHADLAWHIVRFAMEIDPHATRAAITAFDDDVYVANRARVLVSACAPLRAPHVGDCALEA